MVQGNRDACLIPNSRHLSGTQSVRSGGVSFTFLSLAPEKDDSERPWIKGIVSCRVGGRGRRRQDGENANRDAL
jgi:hypothetical protein